MNASTPAFPISVPGRPSHNAGLSTRAYIATSVIQGLLAAEGPDNTYGATYRHANGNIVTCQWADGTMTKENELIATREQNLAEDAVKITDALIDALNK